MQPRGEWRPAAAPGSEVTVRYPDGSTRRFGFSRPTIYVGRGPANDLQLVHPYVASRHLLLQIGAGRLLVTDLGSGGRTRFHGEELEPHLAQRLEEGEVVEIGPLHITVARVLDLPALDLDGGELAPILVLPSGPDPSAAAPRSPDPAPGPVARDRARPRPGRPDPRVRDFVSWRRATAAALGGDRQATIPWPRVLQWVAGTAIFAALAFLVVLALL